MAILKNLKWERFANHLAEGKTQVEAYKLSGFKSANPATPASALYRTPVVTARVKELKRRIENATTARVSSQIAFTRELILRELWENAQEAKGVKGGSAVMNRALELIGKEIGMFKEPEAKAPTKLEDLPQEVLESMLAEAEAKIQVAAPAATEPPKPAVVQ